MADDPDDAPSELSELDLSEDNAITGEDVEDTLGVDEGSAIRPGSDESGPDEPEDEATEP